MTKGAAHRRSFLYSPGAMNPHTWYRIHGDAMKMAVRIGSFTHTILKASMGVIRVSLVSTFRLRRASSAGAWTSFHSSLQNVRLRMNAMPIPPSARRMRERSSSRCSRNDIRSIPSSSSPPSESEGGGGVDPPDPPALAVAGMTAVEVLSDGRDTPASPDGYPSP